MPQSNSVTKLLAFAGVAAVCWCGLASRADDTAKLGSPATQPAVTPSEAEMMAAWQKYATPGPEHAQMAKAAGEWNADMEDMTMGNAKSTGTAKMTMIMGGRYMMEEFSGTTMGMPFTGMMLMGFDNQTKEYTSTWIDNMGTGIAVSHGKAQADGTMEMKGTMIDPVSGKPMATREVIKHDGPDKTTLEMFMPGPGGKEMMAFRIMYTRKK